MSGKTRREEILTSGMKAALCFAGFSCYIGVG
jgi:hypothetical protein